jgi:hypothetical protein
MLDVHDFAGDVFADDPQGARTGRGEKILRIQYVFGFYEWSGRKVDDGRIMESNRRKMVRKGDGASRVKLAGNAARVGPDQLTSSTSLCGESFIAPTKNGAAVLATLGLAKEGMV